MLPILYTLGRNVRLTTETLSDAENIAKANCETEEETAIFWDGYWNGTNPITEIADALPWNKIIVP